MFSFQSLCSITRVQWSFASVSVKMALQRAEWYERLGTNLTARRTLSWPNMKKPLIVKEKLYTALYTSIGR
jgi:hypothetical protein